MNAQPIAPSSDESLFAAISHFFGLLVALIVWATQKDKSRYVRFQTIQAMTFDVITFAIITFVIGGLIVVILVLLALGIGDIALLGNQNPTAEPVRVFLSLMAALPFVIPCVLIPVVGGIFIARLIATIQTFQGKDFRYPWLGALVERAMGK